jgi:hypothetical protein
LATPFRKERSFNFGFHDFSFLENDNWPACSSSPGRRGDQRAHLLVIGDFATRHGNIYADAFFYCN